MSSTINTLKADCKQCVFVLNLIVCLSTVCIVNLCLSIRQERIPKNNSVCAVINYKETCPNT